MTPADKSPREFLVPSSWQIGGPKTESGDYVAVAKADYDKLQQELDAARADKHSNDSDYLKISKQLADAKAQIAEYEAALKWIAKNYTGDIKLEASKALNKWKG